MTSAAAVGLTVAMCPAAVAAETQVDGRDVVQPLDLAQASLVQREDRLLLSIETHEKFDGALLSTAFGRSLCLVLRYGGLATPRARICALPIPGQPRLQLRYTRLDPFGAPYRVRSLKAVVVRPDGRRLHASLTAADLGLSVGRRFTWQIVSTWSGLGECPAISSVGCQDILPDRLTVPGRIVERAAPPAAGRPTRCVAAGPVERQAASPRRRKEVALTFDDGPGAFTRQVLEVLRRAEIRATFFVVGRSVAASPELVRRMLREGHMVANHSLTHARLGGGGARAAHEIGRTQAIIRRATGFTPCLFRPPYGLTSPALNAVVKSQKTLSVLWDVDTRDWRRPGAKSIAARIVGQTRPGSIVLLHDAGGNRRQTVAALLPAIRGLEQRGFTFVTVTDLFRLQVHHRR